MSTEALTNRGWPWLVVGFIAAVVASTGGVVLDEAEPEKRNTWLALLIAVAGTGAVLCIIVGLIRIVMSGLAN